MSDTMVVDATNAVFRTRCWWTKAERRFQEGPGTSVGTLVERGVINITSAMDAFIDAMLMAKWENENHLHIKLVFDKHYGGYYHLACSNESKTRFLSVVMVKDADEEILSLLTAENVLYNYYPWDDIFIVTNDRKLTGDIYAAADLIPRAKKPSIIVHKVTPNFEKGEGVPIIPLHINVRRSHGLFRAKRPLLYLRNPRC